LLTLGSFLKITKVALHIFGDTFFLSKSYVLILKKGWLAIKLGDFFTNSSGHPEMNSQK
jgi:hypothetical protein